MSQILTFLGKGGTGRSTLAVAAARAAAQQGRRVLLVGHQAGPGLEMLLGGIPLSGEPVTIAANLSVVQLRTTQLLEQFWTAAKELEARYVRTPFFREIYGQELGVLPGMDQALALEALRRYDASGQYDCILYDGPGDLTTLRAFGIPEVASWYWRRASQAFLGSDLAKTLRPFADPLLRSVSTVEFSSLEDLPERLGGMTNLLEQGRQAIANPRRVLAHLVTTPDPMAVQTARYLWGSAQMVGLTVGGLWVTPLAPGEVSAADFFPLTLRTLPLRQGSDWSALEAAVGGDVRCAGCAAARGHRRGIPYSQAVYSRLQQGPNRAEPVRPGADHYRRGSAAQFVLAPQLGRSAGDWGQVSRTLPGHQLRLKRSPVVPLCSR